MNNLDKIKYSVIELKPQGQDLNQANLDKLFDFGLYTYHIKSTPFVETFIVTKTNHLTLTQLETIKSNLVNKINFS